MSYDPTGACLHEASGKIRTGMAAADKSDRRHSRGPRGRDASDGILDHESIAGRKSHLAGRQQEQIRRGLAARHLHDAEATLEPSGEPGHLERQIDTLGP